MFNKLNPLIADGGAQNDPSLKEDFKKSVRIEKFYPRGFLLEISAQKGH